MCSTGFRGTVPDISNTKEKLQSFTLKYYTEGIDSVGDRKHTIVCKNNHIKDLEEAVYKCYMHKRLCGVNITDVTFRSSAEKLAKYKGINDFRVNDG